MQKGAGISSEMPGFRSEEGYSASVFPTSLVKLFIMSCLGTCSGIVGCSCLPEVHAHRNKTKQKTKAVLGLSGM